MQPYDNTRLKICTKCGHPKPATTENFARNKSKPDGLESWCKACRSLHYLANKERIDARNRAYAEANKEGEAARQRRWYQANKDRVAKSGRAWQEENRERLADRRRAYRIANRERMTDKKRAYRAANRVRVNEYYRAYYAANLEKVKARAQRRRARKLSAEGAHTATDLRKQYDRQKGRCYWCGEPVGYTYHADHVVPLSRGGTNWPENIVISCPDCNRSKNNKLPHEWPQGGRLL